MGNLSPQGYSAMPRHVFGCQQGGAAGCWRAEARDAATYLTMHLVAACKKALPSLKC
jgi:hypothetical protein